MKPADMTLAEPVGALCPTHGRRGSPRDAELNETDRAVRDLVRLAQLGAGTRTQRAARKLFGPERMPEALAVLDQLALALGPREHHAMHWAGPAYWPEILRADRVDRDAGELSVLERDVLAALATAQVGIDPAAPLAHWLRVAPGRTSVLLGAVRQLAGLLCASGAWLTPPTAAPGSLRCGTTQLPRLEAPEQSLVLSLRRWVQAHRAGGSGLPWLRGGLAPHGFERAARHIHAALVATTVAARRCVDIRCVGCQQLSPDEARVVHAISLHQSDKGEVSLEVVRSWLLPAAAAVSNRELGFAANVLLEASARLPLRAWRFPELCGEDSWATTASAPVVASPAPGHMH